MSIQNLGRIGMVLQGDWVAETAYKRLDVVTYGGGSYACIADNTGELTSNTDYWQLIAEKGDSPEYEWSGTSIRFKNPDGTWGDYVDLVGAPVQNADEVVYDPSSSNLTATDAQAAIDELDTNNTTLKESTAKRLNELETFARTVETANVNAESKVALESVATVTSLPKNAADAPVEVIVDGQTLTNVIKNGALTNASYWSSIGATLFITNSVLQIIGDGAYFYPYAYQDITNLGSDVFVKVKYKPNVDMTSFRVILRDNQNNTIFTEILYPADYAVDEFNMYYKKINIDTGFDLSKIQLRILAYYVDAATATGKVLEIEGWNGTTAKGGVMVIPLTSDIASYTAEQMNDLAPTYFEGKIHVKPFMVKGVTKNLINPDEIEIGSMDVAGNKFTSTTAVRTGLIPVNTDYTYQRPLNYSSTFVCNGMRCFDANNNYIGLGTLTNPLVLEDGTAKIILLARRQDSAVIDYSDLEALRAEMQLEEGSSTTDFVQYEETIAIVPVELGSVPSARDEFNLITGVETNRVDKDYELQASEIISLSTSAVNIDIVVIRISEFAYYSETWSDSTDYGKVEFNGRVYTWEAFADSTSNINTFYYGNNAGGNFIGLCVANSTYADIAAARAALAGTPIDYEKATPDIVQHPYQSGLRSKPSGTIYQLRQYDGLDTYASGIAIENSNIPIDTLLELYKVDAETGVMTSLDIGNATVVGDGLSFTSTDLSDGDLVYYVYAYTVGSVNAKLTINYYDSRFVVVDDNDGNIYSWKIESTDGVARIALTEI